MSLKFMLDTDTVSFVIRGEGQVIAAVTRCRTSDLCISAITMAELRYGTTRRKSPRLQRVMESFTGLLTVMPFDGVCAIEFGRIASDLAQRGTPIGEFDTLIAAHATALGVTLVTNNVKHFSRVRGLKVENWF